MKQLRRKLYFHLDTKARTGSGLSGLNKFISALIVFSIFIVIIETEPSIYNQRTDVFSIIDIALTVLFLLEYFARLWVIGENPKYSGIVGRIKYAVTPTAIIDLMAILPFLLGVGGNNSFLLRALRLLRIFAFAKLGRFSKALYQLARAVAERRYELGISVGLSIMVLLLSATVMYLVEGTHQPEAFGSIPRALWWAIATLTTVGYGDVYPVTPIGKFFAGITALTAIGLIAMPTGVLAAAFSDAFQLDRKSEVSAESPSD